MDPRQVLAKAEAALGLEQTIAQTCLKKRKARPPHQASRSSSSKTKGEERAETKKLWSDFAFSRAYSSIYPGNGHRERGPKEVEAVRLARAQFNLIHTAVSRRIQDLGSPGREFSRAFVAKYERSFVDVRAEPIDEETVACEMRCSIMKKAMNAGSIRTVYVRYRAGPQNTVRDALPVIMSREWADRAIAWFHLIRYEDSISEKAVAILDAVKTGTITIPKNDDENLIPCLRHEHPFAARVVARDEELYKCYRRAVNIWIDKRTPGVLPGWFD